MLQILISLKDRKKTINDGKNQTQRYGSQLVGKRLVADDKGVVSRTYLKYNYLIVVI